MDSSPVVPIAIERVKEIHTAPRLGGEPYWEHPLRCHARLVDQWKSVPLEVQVAMLFHDTLEDIHLGEHVLIHSLVELCRHRPSLNGTRIWKMVRDVTNPEGISREEVITEIMSRFRDGRVQPESYLLKVFDIWDNTTDLVAACQSADVLPDELRAKAQRGARKYTAYLDAIEYGWRTHGIAQAIPSQSDLSSVMTCAATGIRGALEQISHLVSNSGN
ncbi:MAG: hypothetical protein KZQ96_20705 [Candidatus Thiodiazotropha sp. (ex Lucinoma borealis)]|nr:hypothetical protein [Candidatus Thiodiazotropha sp. (ex Lucinoma borealis)]